MNKHEYESKVVEMLQDSNTYQLSNRDPTTRFQTMANKLVSRLREENMISKKEEMQLKTSNSVPPKLYCLRKTHKPGVNLRPVVSCINSPGYNLARYLHNLLMPLTSVFHFNVKDSFHFIDLVKQKRIPENYVLVSLDVISLFTNIPKQLVMDIIKKDFKFLSSYTQISSKTLLDIASFCFETSYFSFQQKIYLQKDGSAMGNPASPVLANIVMNHLISETLKKLPFNIPFLYVYVDDTILAAPKDQLNLLLNLFNSFHQSMQFTMETEIDKRICFLDTEVCRQSDGTLLTNWYSKPSNSGRVLNYYSTHPISQKIGMITGLLHRAINLSSPEFHSENYHKVKSLLMKNNYPINFINRNINKFKHRKKFNFDKSNSKDQRYFRFPYIEGLSHKIRQCFKDTDTMLAFYNPHTTRSLYTSLKDQTPREKNQISCIRFLANVENVMWVKLNNT